MPRGVELEGKSAVVTYTWAIVSKRSSSLSTDHLSGAPRAKNGQEAIAVEPTILLRKLGPSGSSTYLERVVGDDGAGHFIVVERTMRGTMTHEEVEASLADARLAATLEHPNVVRVRDITITAEEIRVTSDYVAGERLSDLWSAVAASGKQIPFDIAIRILIDVATGLGALHHLRSEEGHDRTRFVHGEIMSSNVLVGLDGTSSILRAARVRAVDAAPAIAREGEAASAGSDLGRAEDIHALGGLLWHLLSGHPPAVHDDADKMLANAQRGPVARAIMRSAPWALPLGEVALRALDPIVDKRFPTTSSMITELRKIAGARLATDVQVAKFVELVAGEKIATRLRDVQASTVMRKATSIPPLPSAPPPSVAKRSQRPTVVSSRPGIPKLPSPVALPAVAPLPGVEAPADVEEPAFFDASAVVDAPAFADASAVVESSAVVDTRAGSVPAAAAVALPVVTTKNAAPAAGLVARIRRLSPAMAIGGAVAAGLLITVVLSAVAIHNRREIVTPASTASSPAEGLANVSPSAATPIKAETPPTIPAAAAPSAVAPPPAVASPSSDEPPAKTSTTSPKKTRKQRQPKTPKK